MKRWQTREFKELEREWYRKLQEQGFEDIETEVGGERELKQRAQYPFRKGKRHSECVEEKARYFQLLAQYFQEEKAFEDESDRLIMEKSCQGWSIAQISIELKRLGWPKFNRDTIRYIRRRYESKWGMKFWKPEEMVSRRVTKS